MTLSILWSRLRKRNKRDYRQFQFCITFAVMLISSYLMMVFSPLVKNALPDGGDSLKMAGMIFGIAAAGCLMFVWYAISIFLRYKSREKGIFMALGTEKGILARALYQEMAKMIGLYTMEGIALGAVLSLVIGKIMEVLTARVNDASFGFTAEGFLTSLLFGLVLFLMAVLLTRKAMKRTNIMDVIYEQRKTEKIKNKVTKKYLISGVILIAVGVFIGYFLRMIVLNLFGTMLGSWVSLGYLLVLVGLYQIMVYSISCHERGRNPQKYYNNLLNYGMLKFQGASIVKNMLVITLLIIGGLYAVFYVPMMGMAALEKNQNYQDDYSYRYLKDAKELNEEEVQELAKSYDVQIQNYREGDFIRVVGDGVERDINEEGEFIEDRYEKYAEYDCTSAEIYEKLTGIHLDIPTGGYYLIQPTNSAETTWFVFDDMTKLYLASEDTYLPMKYLGNTEYDSLVLTPNNGLSTGSRFVVNNQDYEALKEGLAPEQQMTQVLFDSEESDREIEFGAALYKEFALRMSENMNVMEAYNSQEELRDVKGYRESGMADAAVVDPEEPAKATDWQFRPLIQPLEMQQLILGYAIRFLLFIYVAVICFAAVGIMGYTRSQNVGIRNAQVFEDIKRLGADNQYRMELLKEQVGKVYILPTVVGVLLALGYEVLLTYGNDGRIVQSEIWTGAFSVLCGVVVVGFQYIMYRKSVRKVKELLKIG